MSGDQQITSTVCEQPESDVIVPNVILKYYIMKKQIRSFPVEFELDWEYEVSMEEIKSDIIEMEEMGVTHIQIRSEEYFGVTYTNFSPITKRLEFDFEVDERIKEEEGRILSIEKEELKELERLKRKYEQ